MNQGWRFLTASRRSEGRRRQGFLNYSHVRMPIRALAAWPMGWMQILNFCISAALTIVFAVGLHAGVQRTRRDVVDLRSSP
jgi:hypothetical protein